MTSTDLYNGWLRTLAKRFQAQFDDMATVHNFEFGSEFEIAICKVLRTILPRRASVCRGYIVAQDGSMAGDDIIIFDSSRFPALRSIGEDLSRKDQVPAEAVLAYIEAKHTLYFHGDSGQSINKALKQAVDIKSLSRDPLEHRHLIPGLDLGPQVKPPPSYPDIKNPWYTAIWSRKSDYPEGQPLLLPTEFAKGIPLDLRPDLIATDVGCLLPMLVKRKGSVPLPRFEVRPFLCADTEHVWSDIKDLGLGFAAVHLLSAIEWIALSEIPWNKMMSACIRDSKITWTE